MLVKPERLNPGDTVAAVSLSGGLAGLIPHGYQACKQQIEETFAVTVGETPNALRDGDWLYRNPKARGRSALGARNDEIKAIFSTIGGPQDDEI